MMLMPERKSKKEAEPEKQDAAFPGTQLIQSNPSKLLAGKLSSGNHWLAPRVIISLQLLLLLLQAFSIDADPMFGCGRELMTTPYGTLFFSTVTADKTLCTSGKSKK